VLPSAAVYQSARRNDSELVFSFLRFSKGDISATCVDVSTRPCSLQFGCNVPSSGVVRGLLSADNNRGIGP